MLKKFLIKLLFTKKQRETIWKAIIFSEYKYRKNGNVDAAINVQAVINDFETTLGYAKNKYSKEEVDEIVSSVLKKSEETIRKSVLASIKTSVEKEIERVKNEAYENGWRECEEERNRELEDDDDDCIYDEGYDPNDCTQNDPDLRKCAVCPDKETCDVFQVIERSRKKEEAEVEEHMRRMEEAERKREEEAAKRKAEEKKRKAEEAAAKAKEAEQQTQEEAPKSE